MSTATNKRRREIMELLETEKTCDINRLIRQFGVAPATLRRDLVVLEQEGQIHRTHGAVHLLAPSPVPFFSERQTLYSAEKDRIAHLAAQFIQSGDTILLDGGTSTIGVLKHLPDCQNLTVITNSIAAVNSYPQSLLNFTILGGQLDYGNLSTYGPYAEQMLDQFYASTLFFSTTGICGTEGLTTHSPYQASIKRKMIQRSQKHILLVDSHKFTQSGTFRFAEFSDVDIVITSEPIQDSAIRQHLDVLGVKVLVAEK